MTLFLLFSLFLSLASASTDKKCKGLVLSGGADKGGYETGFLKALIDFLPPEDYAYDYLAGVSAGVTHSSLWV